MKKGQFITIIIFLILITICLLTIAAITVINYMTTMEFVYGVDMGMQEFKIESKEETYNNNVNGYSQEEIDEISKWWENNSNVIQE